MKANLNEINGPNNAEMVMIYGFRKVRSADLSNELYSAIHAIY